MGFMPEQLQPSARNNAALTVVISFFLVLVLVGNPIRLAWSAINSMLHTASLL